MKIFFLWALVFINMEVVFAHGGIDHSKLHKAAPLIVPAGDPKEAALKNVALQYKSKVEPIFKAKCFDCHSNVTRYPWYHKIPGVNLIINHHIAEAREHLDFSNGFPFISHVTPLKDLKAIEESINEDDMPPWYYVPFHPGGGLSAMEKQEIRNWLSNSRALLAK